jgi:hypothetical protein
MKAQIICVHCGTPRTQEICSKCGGNQFKWSKLQTIQNLTMKQKEKFFQKCAELIYEQLLKPLGW